jgi:hypothetical protein
MNSFKCTWHLLEIENKEFSPSVQDPKYPVLQYILVRFTPLIILPLPTTPFRETSVVILLEQPPLSCWGCTCLRLLPANDGAQVWYSAGPSYKCDTSPVDIFAWWTPHLLCWNCLMADMLPNHSFFLPISPLTGVMLDSHSKGSPT